LGVLTAMNGGGEFPEKIIEPNVIDEIFASDPPLGKDNLVRYP
jgi:hypothetical protein